MAPRSIRQRAIATAGVLAALLAGAATLRAAIGEPPPAVHAQLAASGSISLSNSREGAAIFTLADVGPGDSGEGEVTIGNTGSAPGALALSSLELSDAPGLYGGSLSGRLALRILELSADGEFEVFDGPLASMPELQLGTVEAGESSTYRFVVTMLDGGPPASPFIDDNLYQRASTSLGYQWTLTEVEDGGQEPGELSEPTTPAPGSSGHPVQPAGERPETRLIGTDRGDSLIGGRLDDVIFGRGGADRILGKGGRDYLVGGAGTDWVHGGAGGDRIRGGVDPDRLHGGAGPDTIFARDGEADSIDCGSGRDTVYVDERDRVRNCERVQREYGRLFSIEE